MKNPTTILITCCDNGGYNVDVKEHYSEVQSDEYQYACGSFDSLIDQIVRSSGLKFKYEVTVKVKEE